jgi:hypothetical protein
MKKRHFKYFSISNLKGNFLSLNSSLSIKRFFYLLSSNNYYKINDFRSSFLPIKKLYDLNLADDILADRSFFGLFLFGVNTRFESPVFNLKLKDIANSSDTCDIQAFSFGFSFNNNFCLSYLNNNLYFLINKISGLNYNTIAQRSEKIFFFIFGSRMSTFDLYIKYLLQSFIEIVNNSNINFIHVCASSSFHSLEEIGYSSCNALNSTARHNRFYYPFTFMNFGGSYTSRVKISTFNLVCYLGHHGGSFLKAFNLILPVKFFYEKSLSYINTEGYIQKTGFLKIDYRYHHIKSEKKILDIFGKIFNIDSYKSNLEKFYNINNLIPGYTGFIKNNFFKKLFVYNFRIKKIDSIKQFFHMNVFSFVNNYYLSDYVSSNSVTMSLCSRKFTLFNDFIFIYNSVSSD